ncbi:MAG: prepilin-type N-terminal cleavage/methylation domain-containing protein [Desulfatirhabdiaceae bacterium]
MNRHSRQSGFTLLEILVAMVLVLLVTLISTQALRLTIQAWERTEKEGDAKQIRVALPSLIHNQLESLVLSARFQQQGQPVNLIFCGSENQMSFFSAYAPQGSESQGLMHIRYVYDNQTATLYIYQQVITSEDSFLTATETGSKKGRMTDNPISQISGISDFRLAYALETEFDPTDENMWEPVWECIEGENQISIGAPAGVLLYLQTVDGPGIYQSVFRISAAEASPK